MAGEMRDSFRQAMSELFMGGRNNDAPEAPAAKAAADARGLNYTSKPELGANIPPSVRKISPDNAAAREQLSKMNKDLTAAEGKSAHSDQRLPRAEDAASSRDDAQGAAPSGEAAFADDMPPVFDARGFGGDAHSGDEAGGSDSAPGGAFAAGGADSAAGEGQGEGTVAPRGPVRSTIIAEGTEIKGEVKFGSNAEVYGTLHGNVVSANNITTNTGQIVGDVVAKNMDMIDSEVRGDVATAGDFRVNDKSEMLGNVEASRMDLRGTLVGDTAVKNELNVHSTASVKGDVDAGSIAIGHGAKVKGFVNVGSDDDQ